MTNVAGKGEETRPTLPVPYIVFDTCLRVKWYVIIQREHTVKKIKWKTFKTKRKTKKKIQFC